MAAFAVQFGLIEFSTPTHAVCTPPGEPTVVTDKADYAPAETVAIEGCSLGAWEGQTLTLTVTRPDGAVDTTTVTVSMGKFTYNYLLDGILGIYEINVLDSGSNVIAATTFTDHTSGIVLIRDSSDAFFANSYTTDTFGVTMDITWTGLPDATQIRLLNDATPETGCPAFVSEPWFPITVTGPGTGTFPWTVTGDTVSGLRKVCTQTAYGTVGSPLGILSHEDTIFFRRPNPVLAQTCGLDIVVVLDNSGSIDAGELASAKTAVDGIVTALMPETPTEMALVTFNTSATVVQAFTASESTMSGAVSAVGTTGNFTNWDDGLAKSRPLFPNRAGNADLMIVVSDGHPNRRGGHTLLTHSAGVSAVSESAAMAWAIAEANQAKLDGIRIISLREGTDFSTNNGIGISGTSVHTPDPVSTTVDVFTTDFATLASTLATFAGATCPAKINVHKTIDADGNLGTTGDQSAGAGWTFSCSAPPDTCTPGSGATNGSGNISFDVSMGGDSTATASITETLQLGFGFVSASCTRNSIPIGTPGSGTVTGIGPLAPADTVDCTFYNTPAAYLTVSKVCNPVSDTGLFNLRIDGTTHAANAPCGGTTGPILVSPGSHTVSETGGTGTSLTDYDTVIGGACAADGSVTLAGGESKTCTITNTRKPKLTVNKVCNPVSDTGMFNLRIDGTTYAPNAPCGGTTGQVLLSVGLHTVSETAGTGTSLADYDTVIGAPCAANGDITLAAGDVKTCTITNTKKPKLTVNKVCEPTTDTGLFNIKIDGTTYGADKPCGSFTGPVLLSAGPHTVSETAGTGTNLADYSVVIGGACAANGTVTLAAGADLTCTITNKRLGTIIITKDAAPDDPQDFNFSCTSLGAFQLDDDGANGNPLDNTKTFPGVTAGNIDCAEDQVSGWLIAISCNDPDGGTTIEPPTAHIDVDGGETVSCTFTNTFVPGQSQAVGGIMGLIDDSGGTPPASGSARGGYGLEQAAAIALAALAFAAFAGLVGDARRRAR